MKTRDKQASAFRNGELRGVKASVQARTSDWEMPDIIWPVIKAGLPLTSAVKLGDPSARIDVTVARALLPLGAGKHDRILIFEVGEGVNAAQAITLLPEREVRPGDSR